MQKDLLHWKDKGKSFIYNGLNIFYVEEGDGPCIMIFHGYPFNSFDFTKIIDGLSSRFRVIIPDLPGLGFSDKPQTYDYSIPDYADMYIALCKEAGIQQLNILSHDLGNSVVQEILARSIEGKLHFEIKTIAFLNGGLFSDVYKPRLIQVLLSQSPKPVGKLLSRFINKKILFHNTGKLFGPDTKPSEELLNNFWDILNFNNGKSVTHLIGRLIFEKEKFQPRWIEAMQHTSVPLCFINGPSDPNSGINMVNRYKQLIPKPDIRLLDKNIGHWPQLEAPMQTLNIYLNFILNKN